MSSENKINSKEESSDLELTSKTITSSTNTKVKIQKHLGKCKKPKLSIPRLKIRIPGHHSKVEKLCITSLPNLTTTLNKTEMSPAKNFDSSKNESGDISKTTLRVQPQHQRENNNKDNNNFRQFISLDEQNNHPDASNESRSIYKLKRFLSTLIQFSYDINQNTGEKVKELVFNLVANTMSVNDFHQVLQEVTNFPLRPFVLPFLRSNIPLLSRDISRLSGQTCQTPLQYLRSHQHLLLDKGPEGSLKPEHNDIFSANESSNKEDRKRRLCEGGENDKTKRSKSKNEEKEQEHQQEDQEQQQEQTDLELEILENPLQPKRPQLQRVFPQPWSVANNITENINVQEPQVGRNREEVSKLNTKSMNSNFVNSEEQFENIQVMLNCILGMVDKTKKALAILQARQQSQQSQQDLILLPNLRSGTTDHVIMHQQVPSLRPTKEKDTEVENCNTKTNNYCNRNELLSHALTAPNVTEILNATIRSTEEKVVEVKRRAEEAVQEVKRVAMEELQKAVAEADKRAANSVANERFMIKLALERLRTKEQQRRQQQQQQHQHTLLLPSTTNDIESASNSTGTNEVIVVQQGLCWNCGRSASETCSGCNVARYCSQFCQHKDWDGHHKTCVLGSNNTNNNNGSRNNSADVSSEQRLSPSVTSTLQIAADKDKEASRRSSEELFISYEN